MATDPITIQVIANSLKAIIYEMDAAIERTAMSIIIREQHDFGMSIVDARGYVVAGTSFAGTTLARYAETTPVYPGDVVCYNDPYIAGGEISHLGDTMVAVPIFWGDELIAWGTAWGHHMDLGALAPASMPSSATEVFHEGLQIPPIKLFERGVRNEAVMAILARNSRTPEIMIGDTLALSAAGKIAEKRVVEIIEKFGGDALMDTIQVLFDRAHDAMERLIGLIQENQAFTFEDYLDNDGHNPEPLPIRLRIERSGNHVTMDFTGTAPQCEGPLNFPYNPGMAKMGLYSLLRQAGGAKVDLDPQQDANQGMEDLVTVIIPEGCLLAPRRPAPISLRHLTSGRVAEVVKGALVPIFPDTMPATHNGSLNCISLLGYGTEAEDDWLFFEVMAAGSGGRALGDGLDAFSWNTRLKNAPVEFVETVYPIRIEEYALRSHSAGAGEHRGGNGLFRAIRALRQCKLYFLDERHKTQPWGLYGGRSAAANDAFVERANGEIVELPAKIDALKLEPGDMFVVRTGGGGGWGDPFKRDPAKVAREVASALISESEARDWYGVVIDGGTIDIAATDQLRASHQISSDLFDRGEPVDAPNPGELRTLSAPPVPWLTASVREPAIAD